MATTSKKTASDKPTRTSKKSTDKEKAAGSRAATNSKSKSAAKSDSKSTGSRTSKTGSSSARGGSKTAAAKSSGSTAKKAAVAKSGKSTTKNGVGGKAAGSGSRKSTGSSRSAGTARSGSTSKQSKSNAAKGSSTKSAKSPGTRSKKSIVDRVAQAVGSFLGGGQQDVLDLLKEDHQRVDGLFTKVKAAEDANHQSVFKKIKAELDLHAHVEESIFYPRLMEVRSEELKKIVREGVEEHAQVKTLLAEISELRGTDKVFKAKLKVLMENVEHHVQEEENEMFPLVEDELGEEQRADLARRIQKEKAKVGGLKPAGRSSTSRTKR